MIVCTRCKVAKNHIDFSPDKRTSSGVQSRCKNCFAELARIRRSENPSKHRDAVKRSTAKHYEKKLQQNAKYRANNLDKVKVWKATDRENNKVRVLADNAMRRTKTKGKISSEIKQIYALRDFYQTMSMGEHFHVDHIIPISRGGKHIASNLQVIPAIDNLRKGAK